ncbi:3-isopropylmalate dehydrogenase [Halalkalibacterium halodurans]|uniref:3-isopropylmalate dehydrogenase n=1 Tax=Halalkalibacterium halodurans TaxID=86665 RepID=UPI002E1F3D9D|nr:3-isopropylmalate dehydrogenase [Halalkalibacterium halodurans]MED3647763.1 3-isopropylmalate dehydrogenase [Halalkalibacterium halodurans]
MEKQIAVLPGDGIGPEVTDAAREVLQAVADRFGHTFSYKKALLGGCAIDEVGTPLPEETLDVCRHADGILLGAVGGPKWDTLPGHLRPEKGLLGLRKGLNLFANLRPVTVYDSLSDASTLKNDVIDGVDLLIVRELTGGLYFGEPRERRGEGETEEVVDTLLYTRGEMRRIIRKAFELAMVRNKHVTSVDKANVLESSRMWREVANEVAQEFPEVTLEHMLVDNAAMQLIRRPKQFDVLVTENLFGDILSDEASMVTGSLGMLPSASLTSDGPGLYEPIHGSAPDIAGKGVANPLATIASCAMMLKYSFGLHEEAKTIEDAIEAVLKQGYRTADIAKPGKESSSTKAITDAVVEAIQASVDIS